MTIQPLSRIPPGLINPHSRYCLSGADSVDSFQGQHRVCSSILPDSLHCSCAQSGHGLSPLLRVEAHLNGGTVYSSHDQLAPARHIHLWCPIRGLGTPLPTLLKTPYCEGAKTTTGLQSNGLDDWHRCCATSRCMVLLHKAVILRIVKAEVVNSCLSSHAD